LTPFDSVYYPADNQSHITIVPENYWWLLEEIVEELPAPQVVITSVNGQQQLKWLAVPGARSYRIYQTDDLANWSGDFVTTENTSWIDPFSFDLQFYRVEANMDSLAVRTP